MKDPQIIKEKTCKIQFPLDKLSSYRTELMGVAAIMILICHASVYGVWLPSGIKKIFSLGNLGVEIFFLLSGIGISYSLNSHKSLSKWYKKRYIRILLPYLIIAIPWYTIRFVIHHENITTYLLNISTLNYWLHHKGAWFVAALLPLYLISPILNRLLTKKYSWELLLILVISTALLNLIRSEGVVGNIIFAVYRMPLYFVGMYITPFIIQKKRINLMHLTIIVVATMFTLRSIDKSIGWLWPFVLLIVPLLCYLMDYFPNLKKIFKIFGIISLESYILNICLGDLIPTFSKDFYGITRYSLIVFLGILLAVTINSKIIQPIIKGR